MIGVIPGVGSTCSAIWLEMALLMRVDGGKDRLTWPEFIYRKTHGICVIHDNCKTGSYHLIDRLKIVRQSQGTTKEENVKRIYMCRLTLSCGG